MRDGNGRLSFLRPDMVALLGALVVIILLVTLLGGGLPGTVPAAGEPEAGLAIDTPSPGAPAATATVVVAAVTTMAVRSASAEPATTPTAVPTATPADVLTATPKVEAESAAEPAAANEPAAGVQQPPVAADGPLPTPQGVYSWTLPVPILMYHYVSVPSAGADVYRRDLSTSPTDFRAQMQFLVDNGYTAVTLEDLSLAITAKRDLPPRPVVITLDDGYRDNYQNAFPVLRELGLTATIFVATDFVDRADPNYLTWDMIAEMDAAGIRFEPHSKSHTDLSGQGGNRDLLLYEIKGSQETLEARLGRRPRYFAYPGGRYDADTIAVLDELGFWGAVTTAFDVWHGFEERFEWGRVRLRNATTLAEFADMVRVRQ